MLLVSRGFRGGALRRISATAALAASRAAVTGARLVHAPVKLEYDPEEGVDPLFSEEAFDLHHNVVYHGHIRTLNSRLGGTAYEPLSLIETIRRTANVREEVAKFNAAAEVFNHGFFFDSITPYGVRLESLSLKQMMDVHFNGIENFKKIFRLNALGLFGSGYTWLISRDMHLEVLNTYNAATPIALGDTVYPLLCLDMWEHSYVLDYGGDKEAYIRNFFEVINWDRVLQRVEHHRAVLEELE